MGVIVIEGVVISILVLTGLRQMIMDAIPMDLKLAIGIGIGLFLAIIGFVNGGVVVAGQGTVVTINPDLTTLRVLVFLLTLGLTASLIARNIRGSILIGIAFGTVVATVINIVWGHKRRLGLGRPRHRADPACLDGESRLQPGRELQFRGVLGPELLDRHRGDRFRDAVGLLRHDGHGGRAGRRRPGSSTRTAACLGSSASCSSTASRPRSAVRCPPRPTRPTSSRGAGIGDGGRTGLTSVVVGVLFLAAMFFSPIAGIVPPEATAPALIIVGYLMMKSVGDIDWRDPAIGIPALLTITLMPFTYSITNGVAAGFVSYTLIKVLQGKGRDVHPLTYIVSVLFIGYFVRGLLA